MPAGQQVALEPALAEVLGEHLHHPAVGREVLVVGRRARPSTPGRSPRTRRRAGSTRSRRGRRCGSSVAGCAASRRAGSRPSTRVASLRRGCRARHVDRVVAEVGQVEVAQQHAAVGVRVGAHPLRRPRARSARDLGTGPAVARRTAPPAGSSASTARAAARCAGFSRGLGERHLVRAPRALDRHAVDLVRARSSPSACAARSSASAGARTTAARRAPRPGSRRSRRTPSSSAAASAWCTASGRRRRRTAAGGRSPRAARRSSSSRDPRQHRRVGDLVAVEVQDRQHRAVGGRVEELVRVPARGERPGLGLAVADHAGHDQVGVVERGAVGVRQRVAELAALVDRARASRARRGSGCRRGTRTGGTAAACPSASRRDVRVELACRCPRARCSRTIAGPPWPGPGDEQHVERRARRITRFRCA